MVWFKPPHSHLEGNLGWLNLEREGRISSIKKLSGIRDRNCIISSCLIVIDFRSLALTQDDIREVFNLNIWNPENMTEKLTMKRNLGDWQPASHCLLSWPIYSFINFLALFLCWQLFFFWGIALHLYSKLFWAIKKKNKTKTKHTHTPSNYKYKYAYSVTQFVRKFSCLLDAQSFHSPFQEQLEVFGRFSRESLSPPQTSRLLLTMFQHRYRYPASGMLSHLISSSPTFSPRWPFPFLPL